MEKSKALNELNKVSNILNSKFSISGLEDHARDCLKEIENGFSRTPKTSKAYYKGCLRVIEILRKNGALKEDMNFHEVFQLNKETIRQLTALRNRLAIALDDFQSCPDVLRVWELNLSNAVIFAIEDIEHIAKISPEPRKEIESKHKP